MAGSLLHQKGGEGSWENAENGKTKSGKNLDETFFDIEKDDEKGDDDKGKNVDYLGAFLWDLNEWKKGN